MKLNRGVDFVSSLLSHLPFYLLHTYPCCKFCLQILGGTQPVKERPRRFFMCLKKGPLLYTVLSLLNKVLTLRPAYQIFILISGLFYRIWLGLGTHLILLLSSTLYIHVKGKGIPVTGREGP
jgi:hypothetical protein